MQQRFVRAIKRSSLLRKTSAVSLATILLVSGIPFRLGIAICFADEIRTDRTPIPYPLAIQYVDVIVQDHKVRVPITVVEGAKRVYIFPTFEIEKLEYYKPETSPRQTDTPD
jgi:hypothetical protein